jgi:hypothetical protein
MKVAFKRNTLFKRQHKNDIPGKGGLVRNPETRKPDSTLSRTLNLEMAKSRNAIIPTFHKPDTS